VLLARTGQKGTLLSGYPRLSKPLISKGLEPLKRVGQNSGHGFNRTVAGMQAAKRRGQHVGRPPKLTPHKVNHARLLIAEGKETQAGAAALLGVGVATLRRA
jgi:hypothetical protein